MITNKYLIREKNENLVLKTIIQNQPISRADIASYLGLNKATVSSIITDLLNKEIIIETGTGSASSVGGRKPIFLAFNKKAGFAISIDIGYNYINGIISFLNGEKYKLKKEKRERDYNDLISSIQNIISDLTENLPKTPFQIIGMCVAIHGITLNNNILFTPAYDLDKHNLYKDLSPLFNFPIFLENEANLAAIGDYTFSYKSENLISISIHSGIGAGIVQGGQLQLGANGQAGEIGHTILYPNGKTCPCGNSGCLEMYASNKALYDSFSSKSNIEKVDSDHITIELAKDNKDVTLLVQKQIDELAIGINNLAMLYDPDLVVINSSLFFKNPHLLNELYKQISSKFTQKLTLSISPLGEEATLYGGISKVISEYLNIENVKYIIK